MYLRLFNVCSRSLHRSAKNLEINIRSANQLVLDKAESKNKNLSLKFPSYHVIYECTFIRLCALFNRGKVLQTTLSIGSLPISTLLYLADISTLDTVLQTSYCAFLITIWFHTAGHFFKNVVAYVYIRPEDEAIKVSYVDTFGRRRDIDVTVSDITPFSDMPGSSLGSIYRIVKIEQIKKPLKMYIGPRLIRDKKYFARIFGTP